MTRKLALVPFILVSFATAGARAQSAPEAARADMQKTLGFVPDFVKSIPEPLQPGVWKEVKEFQNNPKTALTAKEKDLIALAVAAQTGSRASIYAYTRCARANGASPAEVGEAVGIAALVRRLSTFFNGIQLDEATFRAEIGKLVQTVTQAATSKQAPPAPKAIAVVDARTALQDIEQAFGFVPEFLKKAPPEALPGLWLQMRDLELGKTALPGKMKSLISLSVASQVPCRYCVVADTEFAKLEGATPREISEAVSMAGVARSFGALIDGLQVDEAAFRRDWDRMTPGADKAVARRNR
jgi:AhpD family alkylhydroperoxidase